MKKISLILVTAFLLLFIQKAKAQTDVADSSIVVPMFSAFYGYQFPGGDMADRFGNNSLIGGDFKLKLKSNWVLGAGFSYIFSQNIEGRDELLSGIRNDEGDIIDGTGGYASWQMFERGFYITGNFGRIFPLFGPNPNSGLMLMLGAGYMQHKIRYDVEMNTAPQLDGDYKKGYDKLTGGPATRQFIGYIHMGNTRVVNFYAGFELVQGWTKALRDYDFDKLEYTSDEMRMDMLYGFKVGWFIPINRREPSTHYYF